MWFFHFARVNGEARHLPHHGGVGGGLGTGKVGDAPGFADIATFFGICVWLAPLFLFLSLSAGDNALPISGTIPLPSPYP
jgi:hypothetical protein